MTSCKHCYNALNNKCDTNQKECTICLRNPKYPSMKTEDEVILEGISLSIPQDMYITKDRKAFEEKRMLEDIKKLLQSLLYELKDKSLDRLKKMPSRPYRPFGPTKIIPYDLDDLKYEQHTKR